MFLHSVARTRTIHHATLAGMSSLATSPAPSKTMFAWLSLCILSGNLAGGLAEAAKANDDNRPYEFSFNIVDFQHRYEKKDADGIITGEYGFVTADGVYHETGYATNKDGDFIITRMRNRKITSLKDAQEIFKDKPDVAKKLVEAVARSCASCKRIQQETEKPTTKAPMLIPEKKLRPIVKEMVRTLAEEIKEEPKKMDESAEIRTKEMVKDMVESGKRVLSKNELSETRTGKSLATDQALEKIANDLFYQFNYTISTHGHHEEGYHSGRKDGAYRAQSDAGIDTRVEYLSNEFGHQPNVSFVPNPAVQTGHALKGYSFRWFFQ